MKEKIKRNIICNSRTVLRAIFCVALLTIGWKLTPKEVSITQDPVVYFVVFAVLAGISLTVRIRENEKFQKIFSVFLLVAVPMICFYNTEYIVGNDLFNITPVAIVLNYCVYLAVFLIFQLLLNQTKWAISLGMVIFCLFAVIDAFVGIFRGVMIRTSDIFAMNTAMNVCFLQVLFPQKCRLNSSKLHGEFPQYCISSSGTLSGARGEPLQAYKVY